MAMNPRLLRPLASGFNPKSIAGLAMWLDASVSSSLTMNGSGVSEFRDLSGNGRHMEQDTAAQQPTLGSINGRTALDFDGSETMFGNTAAQSVARNTGELTMFVVCQNGALSFVGNNGVVFATFIANATFQSRATINQAYNAGGVFRFGGRRLDADSVVNAIATTAATSPFVVTGVFHYAASDLFGYVNGTLEATETSFQTDGLTSDTDGPVRLARSEQTSDYYLGQVGEVLVYRAVLSDAERQKVEGYLAWKWGVQSQLPYDHPYARSFPGFGSQAVPTDADALTYLAAVAAADGTGVEVGVANAVDAFVTGCKADGTWDAIKASCILAGARTLAGALVPLKGSAPTNNNFVSGDYNRKTGLVGGGGAKYLDSNRANNADPQNSQHLAVYLSEPASQPAAYIGADASAVAGSSAIGTTGTFHNFRSRHSGPPGGVTGVAISSVGVIACSRASSVSYSFRAAGTAGTFSVASNAPTSSSISVFVTTGGAAYSNARQAFYSIGESLDLEDLDTRVSALIAAIGAAI